MAPSEPWDLVADDYAADLIPVFEHFARHALRLAALPPSPHIVDVATGPGSLALLAARDGATVSAIDYSPGMVAAWKRRAEAFGLDNAEVRVGDGQALPYDDNAFDGAFSMAGLVFFPDRDAGFRELRRVLRPGRRAVVSSFAPFEGALGLAFGSVMEMLPDKPANNGMARLGDAQSFTREMSAAGFRDVTIHTVTYVTRPMASEFWEKVQRSAGIVRMQRKRLGEARWAEISQGVLERLHEAYGEGPVEEVYTALLGVGTK